MNIIPNVFAGFCLSPPLSFSVQVERPSRRKFTLLSTGYFGDHSLCVYHTILPPRARREWVEHFFLNLPWRPLYVYDFPTKNTDHMQRLHLVYDGYVFFFFFAFFPKSYGWLFFAPPPPFQITKHFSAAKTIFSPTKKKNFFFSSTGPVRQT